MTCGDHKAMIGCVTIIIGDLASLLGCAMQATFDKFLRGLQHGDDNDVEMLGVAPKKTWE